MILVTFVLDIYRVRFRYLKHSSQISVSCKLDIIAHSNLYIPIL